VDIAARISSIGVSSTLKVWVEAERLRSAGVDLVDLGAGEPDFPTPENVKLAASRAIEGNFTKYTAASGTLELREAVCERHARDFGTSYGPGECLITAGGKHAVFNLVQALVSPGDEVVIPVPYWVTYKDVVHYSGGKCVFLETSRADGFRLTSAMLEPCLTARTRMVVVNSPSNPTGAVVERGEFERICALASRRGIYILTDECYGGLVYGGAPYSVASAPGARGTVLVAGSLSKTYAMTGWRVGYALASAEIVGAMLKLQSHSTGNISSISQKAAVEALRGPQDSVDRMRDEYRRRRDYILSRLRAMPAVECAEPEGAFYAFPAIAGMGSSADFAARLLHEARLAIVPGEAFGAEGHIRISYAASPGELKRGMDRLEAFLGSAGPRDAALR
jgi:aspartate aminotransferase